ncbi:MAG: glycosyltransferase [Solirubrobacteraceae bacterium]
MSKRTDARPHVLTLAITAGSGYGGAEKLAYEFALRLHPDRFRSTLCTIRAPDPSRVDSDRQDGHALADRGVARINLGQRGPVLLTPKSWGALYRMMAGKVDIVHAHMPRASVPGALLGRLARVPVVISHEHGSTLAGRRLRPLLDREAVARLSTVIVAVSEWDRRNLIEHARVPPGVIRVIHNGIDRPSKPPTAGSSGLRPTDGTPLVGAVGRLYYEKDYPTLIRAVALLSERGRPVRCVIVGDGPCEAELRALIAALGLTESVLLTGRRTDVHEIVGDLDVAVLSSIWEGIPLAGLEYMAAAAPIVATAVGGLPEMLRDGVDGTLVAPGSPEALADGIARLLDDRALAQRLGASAQVRQRDEFELDAVVQRLQSLYSELLDAQRRPATSRFTKPV